jgi:hypothetical protein
VGQSEAMTGARGQIIWIVALILSTTAIIYLERLEIGAPERSAPVAADLVTAAAKALAAAEERHQNFPEDAESATALVLALSVAVQAGAIEDVEGRARVAALRTPVRAAPGWDSVGVLADLTFGP